MLCACVAKGQVVYRLLVLQAIDWKKTSRQRKLLLLKSGACANVVLQNRNQASSQPLIITVTRALTTYFYQSDD